MKITKLESRVGEIGADKDVSPIALFAGALVFVPCIAAFGAGAVCILSNHFDGLRLSLLLSKKTDC
jgi:hypothetical protein